ncbi:MAG: hypothetical protein HYS13_21800 [Planctomycetia bacterium]|nr:hypothetical protein [Planctomycetia bacterium]
MIEFLLVLVVTFHLAAVGVASVGPLACVFLHWRGARRGDAAADAADAAGRWLACQSFWLLLVGGVLGGLALCALWLLGWDAYFRAFDVVPRRRVWFGAAEYAFSAACLGAYAWGWSRFPRWLHGATAIVSSTNLLYHFPPLFASVVVVSEKPGLWGEPLAYNETMAVLTEPETLSRVAHFLLAATMMTGVALLVAAMRMARRRPADDCRRVASWGGRTALAAALLQAPAGLAVLGLMPPAARDRLLMGDLLVTAGLALGIGVMLVLLHHLLAIALGDHSRKMLLRAVLLAGLLLLLMVQTSHRNRRLTYEAVRSDRIHAVSAPDPIHRVAGQRTPIAHKDARPKAALQPDRMNAITTNEELHDRAHH